VNVAEPAALVCANIMCSEYSPPSRRATAPPPTILSMAEFVGPDGGCFRLSDPAAPNLFGFRREDAPLPGSATSAAVRSTRSRWMRMRFRPLLLPRRPPSILPGVRHEAHRAAIGVLGGEYISTFLSPTAKLAVEVKHVFRDKLKIEFLVLVIGDAYALAAVKKNGLSRLRPPPDAHPEPGGFRRSPRPNGLT